MTTFRGDESDLRVAAYAVVTGERGMLLAHWTDRRHDHWSLPGGGMESGEHPEQTVLREVEEETGYLVELDGLLRIDLVDLARRHAGLLTV